MAKEVLVVSQHHFDPVWRRCFDRPAHKHGVTVGSFAHVEEHAINRWLELAPRGFKYAEGQAAVWRKFLQRNPQRLEELRKRAAEGLLEVLLAGETIQDSVIPTAEGLIRNFLVAAPFYRDFVGENHPALKLAWMWDTFGNSPNYPQVLRGVGAECACRVSYKTCPEDVWVGIDGSRVFCYDLHPQIDAGCWEKHPPCPQCKGAGCQACGGGGIKFFETFEESVVRAGFEQAAAKEGDWVALHVMTEELPPDPLVLDLIDEYNRKCAGKCVFRFAGETDIYRRHLPKMQEYAASRDDRPTVDLNPSSPGCLVTRIRMKQLVRSVAYKLLAAEAKLATASFKAAAPAAPPPPELREAWRKLVFNQFHDAVTGTHIDNAYVELMDMLAEAEKVANSFRPGRKRKPALGEFKPLGATAAECAAVPRRTRLGSLDVTFDLRGITSVTSAGRDLFSGAPAPRMTRNYLIGELTLEQDIGDSWGKRVPTLGSVTNDLLTLGLGDYNKSLEASDRAIRWRGVYDGGDPKVKRLKWTVTVFPSADGRRLDFITEVDWDTFSRRLRVVVPVGASDNTATYEVPFGFIDRKFDPEQISYVQYGQNNNMEFGALHWVRKRIDDRNGVAILNKGLPASRWMPWRWDLSLLRSPESAIFAAEPGTYEFWDIDGQRDAGRHRFEYSIFPYYGGLTESELTRIGYEYNLPAPIDPPFHVTGDVVVTAWKLAESGAGWVLRLQETAGAGACIRVDFRKPMRVTKTDLLERPAGEPATTAHYTASIHKHGILTLLIAQ